MENILHRIEKNTRHKSSYQILLSAYKTNFKTRFNTPIELDKTSKYEKALDNLETYYSFPNITEKNNKYELPDLNRIIHETMQKIFWLPFMPHDSQIDD